MIYNFEFTEHPKYYALDLNNMTIRAYAKSRHSKQEAESMASDVVNKSIKDHGISKVFYNGNHSIVTMADNFFNKIK